MGLLAPLALGFLPLLGLIIALYLLRLRRPETTVSSLVLWDSLLRDREANAPWQRLSASLLLLLQLAVAGALILALARPWAAVSAPGGRNLVLILDTSASMGTADAGPGGTATRLAEAQRQAWARINALPSNGSAAIIAATDQARVVAAPTRDEPALRRALDALTVLPTATDLAPALELAAGLVAVAPDPQVVVYSDGRFPDPRHSVPALAAPLQFVPLGRAGANQAFVALELRRDTGSLALFAQVLNTGDDAVQRRVDVDLDGQAWAGRTLTLPPGATTQLVLDDVPPATQVAHAHLAGTDALPVDDDAWAINRQAEPAPVLLVTGGNRFLQNALVLLPQVALSRSAPADYSPQLTATLTVFDRAVPTTTLPPGNLLFVAPPISTTLFQVSGVITAPVPLQTGPSAAGGPGAPTPGPGSGDPLLRYVDLSAIHVAQAVHVDPPPWARVVLDSADGPLILAGEVDGRRVAILTFDLHDSDLPLQTAFPLLLRNLVGYLLPPPAGGLPFTLSPGAAVDLAADVQSGVDRLTVADPSGSQVAAYPVRAGSYHFTFAGTLTPGVYAVSQWAGGREVQREGFAVNLFSPDESRIGPRAAPPLPRSRPAAAAAAAADPARLEWWQLAAALALLALILEWLAIHRLGLRQLGRRVLARRRRERFGTS